MSAKWVKPVKSYNDRSKVSGEEESEEERRRKMCCHRGLFLKPKNLYNYMLTRAVSGISCNL